MKDLHCMSFTSKGASEILVAGCQDVMYVIDANRGEIVKQVSLLPPASRPRINSACLSLSLVMLCLLYSCRRSVNTPS